MSSLTRLSLALVLCTSSVAVAAPTVRDMVVHTTKTMLDLKLDATSVQCSGGELVVVAPKLAALTLMNHDDATLALPALSAGTCAMGRMPSDIIDPANPVVSAQLSVKAIRQDHVDVMQMSCYTYLVERVETTIRGVTFAHEDSTWLGSREISECNGGDSPADDPGHVDETDAGNSCATTHGGSLWFGLALALGLVLRRRR